MNPSLLLGIIIGAAFVFLVLLAVVSISGRKPSNASREFNERSLDQLTIRNGIGHNQLKILSAIDESLVRANDRKARRERIATAMAVGLLGQREEKGDYSTTAEGGGDGNYGIVYRGQFITANFDAGYLAEDAVELADALIDELDKPETEPKP